MRIFLFCFLLLGFSSCGHHHHEVEGISSGIHSDPPDNNGYFYP